MSDYDTPPRSKREHRPRYYDDDASDEDNYGPSRRDRRAPPADSDPPASGNPRRKSILVDPDEPASQRASRRRSRSAERVRIRTDSSDDNYDGDTRRGPPRPRLSRKASRDLESKTTDENKKFRARRDGYESEEGETLRKTKRSGGESRDKTRRRDYDDYDDGYPPDKKDGKLDRLKDKLGLPMRGKPRDDPPPYEYGATPIAAGAAGAAAGVAAGAAAASARPKSRGYDTDPERQRARARTWDEDDLKKSSGKARDRGRYDDDGYDRRPRPRPRNDDVQEDAYRSGGRGGGRRDRYDDNDDGYGRREKRTDGYRSDRDGRGGLPTSKPKYDSYNSDSREDRANPRPRNHDRDDRRPRDDKARIDRPRDDYYDRRDRDKYRDDYPDRDRRDRDRRGKKSAGNDNWQKQAGVLFTTYALPVIKREGTKLLKKEVQSFLEKR